MNIFELFGTIAVNNQEANKAINDTGKKGADLATKMGKAFDKMGKFAVNCGKVVAKGLAVGSAAMAGLVVKGMNLAGELEQNMGGSQQVFQEFAKNMQKTAQEAYKNMGLSQSDYLATANKMGALFQGVGYSIEDSADITEKAMQRASDVASIMGLDVSAAMESIAGAAKGNFTMMDNLGVAINDTAIANYAMEKGIKTANKQMTTQEKVAIAMEMFLEKTAYAAGNYAKENDTLAGSLTTAKAAFTNFLAGAGDADALTDALVNASDVISKNLNKLLPSLVKGLNKLMTNLTPKLPELIRTTLPGIIEGAGELLAGLAMALPDLIDVAIDVMPEMLGKLGNAFERGWNLGVWPLIQKLFKSAFNIDLPKWHKFKWDLGIWWEENVKPVLENIKNFGSDVFGWFTENKDAVIGAVTAIGLALVGLKFMGSPASMAVGAVTAGLALIIGNWDTIKAKTEEVKTATEELLGIEFKDDGTSVWDKIITKLGTILEKTETILGLDNLVPNSEEFTTIEEKLINGEPLVQDEPLVVTLNKIKKFNDDAQKYLKDNPLEQTVNVSYNMPTTNSMFQGKGSNTLGLDSNKGGTTYVPGHANGLDFVPRDEYLARLHYGEAVLTRKEADVWRKGGNNAQLVAEMQQMREAFAQTMEAVRNQPVAIQVDSRAVAVLMAKEMTRSIGNRNIQTLMGMGG